MVNFCLVTCILAAIVMAVNGANNHQKPPSSSPGGPAPSVDCSSLIYQMVDCMGFVSVGGNETKPEDSCCSGFKVVLNTDSDCICYALESSASLGIDVNMTKAMSLPSVCGISAPPLNCNVSPGAAPANPPSGGGSPPKPPNPPAAPAPPLTPDGGTTPAPSPTTSGAYTLSISLGVLLGVCFSMGLI